MTWTRLRNERGNVLMFTIGLLVLMLVMGGIAVDLAYYAVVDNELHRATDAAALAGAGKLGFDDTVFPTARSFARNYAAQNPWRDVASGPQPVDLALNGGNDPAGNIVLGIWDPTATPKFTPSTDGTRVNAVLCRTNQVAVPTTFFRLIGITSMAAFAESIATANPPANPPPSACLFPMALSSCFFGGATSAGCGATMTGRWRLMMPAFSRAICASVLPSCCVWSRLMLVMIETSGLQILVASSRPPRPTSSTAMSTSSRAK
jgi:Flp pilus assembly protein TadG